MIQITQKTECCGCSACAERCPRKCILMQTDEEGFLYPKISENDCIQCNLCDSVCPITNEMPTVLPSTVLAAKNVLDDIRMQSSSGGIFTAIAEGVISEGGVVFGACFNDHWQVVHGYTETVEGLASFRGSKYVQSCMGNSYYEAEQFLKNGRIVLFSGTPCQIAGLKCFLRKDYVNLLTVDIICHGVPSPKVWEKYVDSLRPKGAVDENSISSLKEMPEITGIFFRDKRAGWRKYGFSVWGGATEGSDENTFFPPNRKKKIKYEILQQNLFMRGFLQHLYLRPSCHDCMYRDFKSGSDLTLGDFWGIESVCPDLDDDKGTSIIIQKNNKLEPYLYNNRIVYAIIPECSYDRAYKGNSALFRSPQPNKYRKDFWESFLSEYKDLNSLIEHYSIYSNRQKIGNIVTIVLLNLHLYKIVNKILVFISNRK